MAVEEEEAIEEQSLPRYHERHYYPVKIGKVFKDQYRVIAKLGYGAYSTVWLAWDQRFANPICFRERLCREHQYSFTRSIHRAKQYTSLKVCVGQDTESSPVLNEINMLRRLKRFADTDQRDLPGVGFTRLADDIFEIDGACFPLWPILLHCFKGPRPEYPHVTGDISGCHPAQASCEIHHPPAVLYILVCPSKMARNRFVSTR